MNNSFFQNIFKEGIVLVNEDKQQENIFSTLQSVTIPNLFLVKTINDTQEETLLNKIVFTCTNKGKDIKTLTIESPFTLIDLQKNKSLKNIFLFDYTSTDIGLDFKEEKYMAYDFGIISVVFADSLSILNTKNEAKTSLWKAMKKILDI